MQNELYVLYILISLQRCGGQCLLQAQYLLEQGVSFMPSSIIYAPAHVDSFLGDLPAILVLLCINRLLWTKAPSPSPSLQGNLPSFLFHFLGIVLRF